MAEASRGLEFGFEQGWARGLSLGFWGRDESARLKREDFHFVDQVHGREIIEIGAADALRTEPLGKADGVCASGEIARSLHKPLLIRTADCAPICYVDRVNERIALVHAGWRGLAQGIHRRPFESFGFDPRSTWVWVGPCLNGLNFEVGEDMWTQFPKHFKDPAFFAPVAGKADKRHFQSWKFMDAEFTDLKVEVLYNVETDTFEDETFASYRRCKARGEALTQQNYTTLSFRS